MRGCFVLVVSIVVMLPSISSAFADGAPTLDVRPVCRGIASQSADPLATGLKSSYDECINSEQSVREQLNHQWSSFSAADKRHCVTLANTGGESSYTELLTCLEMSRDVRTLSSAAPTAAFGADVTNKPSATPSPTTRPAPYDKAPPPATKEPSVSQVGEPKKELELAKADALAAKASEASAQRKLADTEAALRRTKEEEGRAAAEAERAKDTVKRLTEEAGRATAEAERAKADAKAARQSETAVKSKLADAEAALTAAEAREQACRKSGFGARVRSWFRFKNP